MGIKGIGPHLRACQKPVTTGSFRDERIVLDGQNWAYRWFHASCAIGDKKRDADGRTVFNLTDPFKAMVCSQIASFVNWLRYNGAVSITVVADGPAMWPKKMIEAPKRAAAREKQQKIASEKRIKAQKIELEREEKIKWLLSQDVGSFIDDDSFFLHRVDEGIAVPESTSKLQTNRFTSGLFKVDADGNVIELGADYVSESNQEKKIVQLPDVFDKNQIETGVMDRDDLKSGNWNKIMARVHKKKALGHDKFSVEEQVAIEFEERERADEEIERTERRAMAPTSDVFSFVWDKLREMGCNFIDAPDDAERWCSYMTLPHVNTADTVVSADYDTLAFGVRKVVMVPQRGGFSEAFSIEIKDVLKYLNLSMEQFIDMSIICGTDYCNSPFRVGPGFAIKWIRSSGTMQLLLPKILPKFKSDEDRNLFLAMYPVAQGIFHHNKAMLEFCRGNNKFLDDHELKTRPLLPWECQTTERDRK